MTATMNALRPNYTTVQQQQIRDTARSTSSKLIGVAYLVAAVAAIALAYVYSGAVAALAVTTTTVTLPFALLACAVLRACTRY